MDSAGLTQDACQKGSVFRLVSGRLFSDEDQVSVSGGVPEQRLSTSGSVEAIDSIFAISTDQTLVWNNDAFENGTARFGTDSAGVYGVFQGALSPRLAEVSLKAIDRRSHKLVCFFQCTGRVEWY